MAPGGFCFDVVVEEFLEGGGELVVGAFEGDEFFAVDVDGAAWLFAGAGKADADVGGAGFAGTVDDAAHDGELQFFHAFVLCFPFGHFVANVALDAFGELLKRGVGGASAAGASGDAGSERAQAEGLEEFAGGVDFVTAVAAGARRERDANGVADAFGEKDAHGRRGPDQALGGHAGFGEAEVQRLIRLAGEFAIDADEVTRARNFAGNDDLILAQAAGESEFGRLQRGDDHAFVDDFLGGAAEIAVGVLLHFLHDQFLVERAAVDADAHGLSIVHGDFADGGELFVAAGAFADVAGIDAVFVEGFGAFGIFGEKNVAVVVKIADERRVASGVEDAALDFRDGGGGFGNVDGDADEFGAGLGEFKILFGGGGDVGGIGVGDGLDDDGRAAADLDFADLYADRFVTLRDCGLHGRPFRG